MPNKKRLCIPGSSYHITNRGNRKSILFIEEIDYKVYLGIVKNTLEYYKEDNYKLVCYCLMSNHMHLILKTADKDPSYFMRRVTSMYAKYFNDKYEYCGHVFQGNFFSNIITNELELLDVSKYIHLNPVKAKIVERAEDYRWSSYNHIVGDGCNKVSIIDEDDLINACDILLMLGEYNKESIRKEVDNRIKYKMYVEKKVE